MADEKHPWWEPPPNMAPGMLSPTDAVIWWDGKPVHLKRQQDGSWEDEEGYVYTLTQTKL